MISQRYGHLLELRASDPVVERLEVDQHPACAIGLELL